MARYDILGILCIVTSCLSKQCNWLHYYFSFFFIAGGLNYDLTEGDILAVFSQ